MAYEKEIALNLTVKAEQYNAGMAKAAKTTAGMEEAARKASEELDQMEKEAEAAAKAAKKLARESEDAAKSTKKVAKEAGDAAKSAGKLAAETSKPLNSKSAKEYAIEAAKLSRATRQAAADTRLLGTAAVTSNSQIAAAQKTLVRFRGSLSDISRESQRFRAATSAIRATQPRYIQHSGPEFSHTAEQLQRYARAAASTAGQITPLEQNTTRTARAIAGLRTAAQDAAVTLRGPTAQALATSVRGVGDLAVEAGKVAVPIAGIGAAIGAIGLSAVPLGAAVVAMGAFGAAAIRASENINQLRGSIAAIVAANEKVTDSSGNILEGVDKIKAVQVQVSAVFKQLQIDALKTSDTTEGLIDKFSIALAPGFAQGWSLDQIRKITVAASTSMSALRIPQQQAASEMRALLTGDELDNSQLAKGLGIFTKADWSKLAEGGKLFQVLNDRMKDFVAAGGEQSKSLTGILSSLEDFNTKLMALAGNDATETLARGFGEVLAMVQNTDGSVTPLGQNLIDLAEISGYYVNSVAKDFIWLAKKIAEAGEIAADVARTFQIASIKQETGEKRNAALTAITSGMVNVGGKRITVGDAINRKAANDRLIADNGERVGIGPFKFGLPRTAPSAAAKDAAARENALIGAAIKPFSLRLDQIRNPNYVEDEAAAASAKLFNTYDDSGKPSGNTYTPRPFKRGGGAKAAGAGKKDPRIAEAMRKMRNELQTNDAKELGFSGQIKIYEKYLPILKAIKGAETEYTETLANRKLATVNLTKKQAELSAASKKELQELDEMNSEASLKRANEYAAAQLEFSQKSYDLQLSALEGRYSAELISSADYYKERQALQVRALMEETETERQNLKRREEFVRNRLTKELAKRQSPAGFRKAGDQDPKIVASLTNELKGVQDEQGFNKNRETLGVGAIATETAIEQASRARANAKQMISAGLADVFSTLNIPMADGVTKAFSHGIQQALEGSSIGSQAAKFFGDAFTSDAVFGALKTVGALIADSFAKEAESVRIAKGINKQIRDLEGGDPAKALENRKLDIAEQIKEAKAEIDSNQPTILGDILRQSVGMLPASRTNAAAQLPKLKALLERQAEEDSSNAQMAAASEAQSRGDLSLDQYLKVLENLPVQTQEVTEEIRRVIEVATEEGAAAIAAAHAQQAEVLAQIARENETTARKIADSWEGAADRIQEGFRQVREAQERALNADAIGRDVLNIYGRGSAAENDLATIDARIKAAEAERVAIGRRNRSLTLDQNETLGKFASVSATNMSSVANGEFQPYGSKTFTTDVSSFVEDIGRIQQWINDGIKVTNSAGEILTQMDIPRLVGIQSKFAEYQKQIEFGNADASELEKLISELKLSKEVPTAQIRQGSKDTAKALGMELEGLRAGLTPGTGDDREIARKRIDEEIKQREREYANAGFLGSGADKESSRAIRKNLEEMRSLMYQQLDKDSYTEANPLPVRVVDNRPLFANPDSFYFRQRSVSIAIGDGAIRIDGAKNPAGLGPDLLNQLRAIVPDLDRELSRNSNLDSNRVST